MDVGIGFFFLRDFRKKKKIGMLYVRVLVAIVTAATLSRVLSFTWKNIIHEASIEFFSVLLTAKANLNNAVKSTALQISLPISLHTRYHIINC